MSDENMVDINWFAKKADVSPHTISNWIYDPEHPAPKGKKLGTGRKAPRRWWPSEIMKWLEEDKAA